MEKRFRDLLKTARNIDERLILLVTAIPDDHKMEVEAYLKAIVEKALS